MRNHEVTAIVQHKLTCKNQWLFKSAILGLEPMLTTSGQLGIAIYTVLFL